MKFDLRALGQKTWETFYALDSFDIYRREIERLIKSEADLAVKLHGPAWNPHSEEEREEWYWESKEARRTHDEVLTPMFRYSLVVTLFSLHESQFVRVINLLEKEHPKRLVKRSDLAGDTIPQCFKYLELLQNVGNPMGWAEARKIDELRIARNCIVHCNGEVSQSKEKSKLLNLWGSNGSFESHGVLCVDGAEIMLAEKFLADRFEAVWTFYIKLFNTLGWKVADCWVKKSESHSANLPSSASP